MKEDLLIVDNNVTALKQLVSKQVQKAAKERRFLHSELKRIDKELRSRQAELRSLLNNIRDEIQVIRGQVEENTHFSKKSIRHVERLDNQLKKEIQEIRDDNRANLERVVRLEEYLGLEPAQKIQLPEKESSDKKEVKDSPQLLYASAKRLFDKGDYDNALDQFQEFIRKYPGSENADNAQFWIGEIYYHQKWYEKAIVEYQKVIEKYPNGNKVAGALLKQGFAFLKLKQKTNARLILTELITKFPHSAEAKIAKKKLKRM